MSEIAIAELEPGTFTVQVEEGHGTTTHRVHVDAGLLDAAGLGAVEPEVILRETFAFLLEREPATAIMSEFGLRDVQSFFPDYTDELIRRLS